MFKGAHLAKLLLCTSISLFWGLCFQLTTSAADSTTDALAKELKRQGFELQETKGGVPRIGINNYGMEAPWLTSTDPLAFCKQWVEKYHVFLGLTPKDLVNPKIDDSDNKAAKIQAIKISFKQNYKGIPVKPGGVLFVVRKKGQTEYQMAMINNEWVENSALAKLDAKPKLSWDKVVDKAATHYLSQKGWGTDFEGQVLPHNQTAATLKPVAERLKKEKPHTLQIYAFDIRHQSISPRLVYEFLFHEVNMTIDAHTGEVLDARSTHIS